MTHTTLNYFRVGVFQVTSYRALLWEEKNFKPIEGYQMQNKKGHFILLALRGPIKRKLKDQVYDC